VRRERRQFVGRRFERFREPKIRQLRVAVFRDENIGRLEIAVQDPRGVGGGQAIGDAGE
jgi:hypothetical protein